MEEKEKETTDDGAALRAADEDVNAETPSPPRSPPTKRLRTGSPSVAAAANDNLDVEDSKLPAQPSEGSAPTSSPVPQKEPEPPSSADTPESSPAAASPTTTTYAAAATAIPTREVPPAPPSTPASSNKDTISSPELPDDPELMSYPATIIQNAEELEKALKRQAKEASDSPQVSATEPTPHAGPAAATASAATITKKPPPLIDDFSEWAVGDRYEMVRMLGRGSYGEVAQAKDLWAKSSSHAPSTTAHLPQHVAIKRITSAFDQEIDAIRLYREMHILRKLSGHDCIIHLLDVVQPPTDDPDDFHDLYLVFEYVDTDLYKLIMSPQYLTTEHIQTFLYQMLAGLKYIHSASVIHRDLKPANILLNEDCSLKICDFGLARIVETEKDDKNDESSRQKEKSNDSNFPAPPPRGLTRQLTKHVVTRWYRAPELILVQPYTSAVDIWSLGCILAELLSMQEGNVPDYQDRMPLFPGGSCYPLSGGDGTKMNKEARVDQLSVIFGVIGIPDDLESIGMSPTYRKAVVAKAKQQVKPLETIYPTSDPLAIDLLKQMLQFDPSKRCTTEQALQHPFLKAVRTGGNMEILASQPLRAPSFLESQQIDLATLKHRIMHEVRCYEQVHATSSEANKEERKPSAAAMAKTGSS